MATLSSVFPLRPPLADGGFARGAVNLRKQFGSQKRFEGLEFIPAAVTAKSLLEAAGFKLRAHTAVRSAEVESVSVEDRVKKAEKPFWECWRDEDDFGPIDAMIARGWGDVQRFIEEKDAITRNADFDKWMTEPGPDKSFSAARRAKVSQALKEKHAARRKQERLYENQILNPKFVKK